MALIKCPECNKEFSDQAKCCPNCGFPTDEILKNIKAEKTKKQSSMMKKMLLILATIIGILAVVFIIRYIKNQPDKNGYYEGLTWNTTYDEIKKKYPEIEEIDPLSDADKTYETTVQNLLGMKGVSPDIFFSFKNDKLSQVYFIIQKGNIADGIPDEVSQTLYEKFDKAYGDGEDKDFMDIRLCEWDTEKSKITVFTIVDGLTLAYEDIALLDD